jgi:transposase
MKLFAPLNLFRQGKPQSKNYLKARNRSARKHLGVSRKRKEYAKRLAYCVIQSNDLIVYEDLNVKGMLLLFNGESMNEESSSLKREECQSNNSRIDDNYDRHHKDDTR